MKPASELFSRNSVARQLYQLMVTDAKPLIQACEYLRFRIRNKIRILFARAYDIPLLLGHVSGPLDIKCLYSGGTKTMCAFEEETARERWDT